MKVKESFPEVCRLVEMGFTISEAFDELGIHSKSFYRIISDEQKLILNQIRIANTLYGDYTGLHDPKEAREIHEYFTSNDYAY